MKKIFIVEIKLDEFEEGVDSIVVVASNMAEVKEIAVSYAEDHEYTIEEVDLSKNGVINISYACY